ncbi:MAG: ERCC4 domain-containing protein [Desulfobacterales bacterium]
MKLDSRPSDHTQAGNGDPEHFEHTIWIVADDREPADDVIAVLHTMPEVRLEITRLALGDYQVDRRVLVERKRLPDFARSVVDGRLFRQTIALAQSSCRGVLILEGTGRDLQAENVRREALQGALVFVSLILGIPVLRSQAPEETARLMVYCARQLAATAQATGRRSGYRPKRKRRRQLYILQGLPGIGPELAKRLLEVFGSVSAVATASEADLRQVAGIGSRTAEKIKWAVSENPVFYGHSDLFPL